MTDQTFVGVDVAKDWVDIHHASHGATRINNRTRQYVPSLPVAPRREPGSCSKPVAATITSCVTRSNRTGPLQSHHPRQARDFARAMGVIGKTDRVDARMLAELGARLTPLRPSRCRQSAARSRRRRPAGASLSRCVSRKPPASSRPRTRQRAPTFAASSPCSIAGLQRLRRG